MKLSVIIPVFNEEAILRTTDRKVSAFLESLFSRKVVDDYEVIYVDDGSTDNSSLILKEFSSRSPKTKAVLLSRNFGHQRALAAGIVYSSGDAVVTLDADLQDPPELIEEMLKKSKEGVDIVYAARRERESDSFFKKNTARFFYRAMQLMGVNIVYDHADYRLISRKVVKTFKEFKEFNIFLRGLFPSMGFSHETIYYDRQERAAGRSKYPFWKMLSFAWEGITSFSIVPLRLASISGFLVFLTSLGCIVWALYTKMRGMTVPGWTSIVIPIFFIGGLNMFFLGIVGEYLGKIYLEVKRRPVFIVAEKLNFDDQV